MEKAVRKIHPLPVDPLCKSLRTYSAANCRACFRTQHTLGSNLTCDSRKLETLQETKNILHTDIPIKNYYIIYYINYYYMKKNTRV